MWLIAEDDEDIRMLVQTLAMSWGYQSIVFESGQRVWEWLDKVEEGQYSGPMPEFALMDIRMPGKAGNEVADRMRAVSRTQHIPIVLMTAFALNQEQKDNMTRNGADEIIHKPLPDFDQLHQILHEVIQNKN
jgi:CheY-like chemotaxis protein